MTNRPGPDAPRPPADARRDEVRPDARSRAPQTQARQAAAVAAPPPGALARTRRAGARGIRSRSASLGAGAVILAAATALTACGGETSEPRTSPTVAASDISRIASANRSATSSPAPQSGAATATSSRSRPTSSATAGYPVPEAAQAHTHEGAKAFVRFYWETLERLGKQPQTDVLPRLAAPECKACGKQEEAVKELVAKRAHLSGVEVTLSDVQVHPSSTADAVVLTFRQDDSAGTRVSPGRPTSQVPADHLLGAARVEWVGGGWRLKEYGADPQ